MNKIALGVIERTVQKTHIWLKELTELMDIDDQHLAYLALRGVLHALRDRLPVEIVAKLGAQLPLLIRGIYYEGWVPSHTPIKVHTVGDFLAFVAGYLEHDFLVADVESVTENVFEVIRNHLSEGEIERIRRVLPRPLALLLPL